MLRTRNSLVIASLLSGFVSLAASMALADARASDDRPPSDTVAPNPDSYGHYHSFRNGIDDYDGFDRFRDERGNPLPGWEWQLRSPG